MPLVCVHVEVRKRPLREVHEFRRVWVTAESEVDGWLLATQLVAVQLDNDDAMVTGSWIEEVVL